jgi:hypothetical protein
MIHPSFCCNGTQYVRIEYVIQWSGCDFFSDL